MTGDVSCKSPEYCLFILMNEWSQTVGKRTELKIVKGDPELNAFSHCNPSKSGNIDFGLGSSSQHTTYN